MTDQNLASSHTVPRYTPFPLPSRIQTAAFRHRWPAVLGVWTLVVLLSVTGALLLPVDYTSTAQVRINLSAANAGTSASTVSVDVATESKVATSEAVAQHFLDQTETALSLTEIREQTTVSTDSETSILTFEATASTPGTAQELVEGMARAYLEVRSEQLGEDREALNRSINEQLEQTPHEDGENPRLNSQLYQLKARVNATTNRIGRIISSASEATSDVWMKRGAVLGAGVFGGLLLGLATAALLDRLDPRIGRRDRLINSQERCPFTVRTPRFFEDAALLARRIRRERSITGTDPNAGPIVVVALPQDAHLARRLAAALSQHHPGGGRTVLGMDLDLAAAELIDSAAEVLCVCTPKTLKAPFRSLQHGVARLNAVDPLTVFCC